MARLELSLLGPLRVTLDGQSVTSFKYDKVRALLAYLGTEAGHPHRRDTLLGLLWPDWPESAARNNLRQALATLREVIRDRTAEPPFLLATRESVQFNPESDHLVDVSVFRTLIQSCERHSHRRLESCQPCMGRLKEAVALYKGDFLTHFFLDDSNAFEEWAAIVRERLRRQVLEALFTLVAYHERRAEFEQALQYTYRQLELEPWREEAHRQVMRLLLLRGERGAALAQYENCRQILADELGVEPEEETTSLYESIRAGELDKPHGVQRLTLPAKRPHNLPPQLTPFLGREVELAEIAALLQEPECRLLTIGGPGGIGKTRLALQAATEQLESFADGVYFVPLASLDASELLIQAITDAIKCNLTGRVDPRAELLDYLREKEMLLVLDTFEHLLHEAEVLADILAQAPEVMIVLTSREWLNVRAEWAFEIQGLALPGDEQEQELQRYSATELFLQSARRADARFTLTQEEAAHVVRVCRAVEGMPLAIELAAAWVRSRSCLEIAGEVERSLAFLTTSLRDVPSRHRSMRAVFDYSWELLSPQEQAVFCRLSVFRGGFLLEAAEQVAGATPELLSSLVDKLLVRRTPLERYDLHELLRQYAHEKLVEAGEREQVREAHLVFFLDLAEMAEPHLTGGDQLTWLEWLEREHDNLRAALSWGEEGGGAGLGLRLGAALWRFWWMRGHLSEGRRWLAGGLVERDEPAAPTVRARALNGLGVIAYLQADYETARGYHLEALALRRALGDMPGVASSLGNLANIARAQGDQEAARALYQESLEVFKELENRWGIATSLLNLGTIVEDQGDPVSAAALYAESLEHYRELGDEHGVALALGNLADAAHHLGEYERARALYIESLKLRRAVGDPWLIAYTLEMLGMLAVVRNEPECAVRLFAAGSALREEVGVPLTASDEALRAQPLAEARARLGENSFATNWEEGRTMPLDQAIALALQE